MSYQATKAVLDGSASIKGPRLAVLSALAEWADSSGKVIYQQGALHIDVIAARARCVSRTASSAIRWLEERNYLTVTRVRGRGLENRYYLNLDWIRQDASYIKHESDDRFYAESCGDIHESDSTFSGDIHESDDRFLGGVKVPYLKHNEESESAGAREKKTTLPPGFSVTAEMHSWAIAKFPELDVGEATETWQDDMVAKGFEYSDWQAAWRKGMRNAVKWAAERAAKNGNGNGGRAQNDETTKFGRAVIRAGREIAGLYLEPIRPGANGGEAAHDQGADIFRLPEPKTPTGRG